MRSLRSEGKSNNKVINNRNHPSQVLRPKDLIDILYRFRSSFHSEDIHPKLFSSLSNLSSNRTQTQDPHHFPRQPPGLFPIPDPVLLIRQMFPKISRNIKNVSKDIFSHHLTINRWLCQNHCLRKMRVVDEVFIT